MKKLGNLLVPALLVFFGLLAACENPIDNTDAEEEQARLDSLAQAEIDNSLMDDYIADPANGIDADQVVVGDYGVRHIVWDPAIAPDTLEYNSILSLHQVGKFTTNQIFVTTNEGRAIIEDSLNWVARGIDFTDEELLIGVTPPDTVTTAGKDLESILLELSSTKEPLDITLYKEDKLYIPETFNYTFDGREISFNYPVGYRSGLIDVIPKLKINSKALIMIPSYVAFGPIGSGAIAPDEVVLYELTLVNIRP